MDAQGRVVGLNLGYNGLSGAIPSELGGLSNLERLNLGGNDLSGAIPPELGDLANLVSLWLGQNDLSGPIPPELGSLSHLGYLALSGNDLSGAIPPELGGLPNLVHLGLYGNELSGAIPPELGSLSHLGHLALNGNDLSGAIPPELGSLSHLGYLALNGNDLSGPIPSELGDLADLRSLYLSANDLSGAIPPELGGLPNLVHLGLYGNELSGAIPPELGSLSHLGYLALNGNDLSGLIPPELGDLANLEWLYLGQNSLSGPVPLTFGGLASLVELELSHNAGLAGAMPAGLRDLALESLMASGTELCVPREPAFEEWLATIPRKWIAVCEPPAAYLVQAVQSRAHPVPLVAGEDALLRVFVTAAMETTEGIPDVRARFYLNGTERHVADIPGSSTPIPAEIDEGDLLKSANAEIPGRIVQPGLEMVVEIDPDGVLDASLGVAGRIPLEGRLAVEVAGDAGLRPHRDPVPVELRPGLGDHRAGGRHGGRPGRPLPAGGYPRASAGRRHRRDGARAGSERQQQPKQPAGPDRGDPRAGGWRRPLHGDDVGIIGHRCRRSRVPLRPVELLAAELGHGRPRARTQHESPARPVRGRGGTGPVVPVSERSDRRLGVRLRSRPPGAGDAEGPHELLRSHLDQRLPLHQRAQPPAGRRGRGRHGARRWPGQVSAALGGRRHNGHPLPQPRLRRGRPARAARLGGRLHRDRAGRQRPRSLLPQLHDAVALSEEAEASSFVFALPAQAGWADALASVTLSGPAGTVTLDGNSDTSMAILRDPVTGRVRGFLRDLPSATELAADAVGVHAPGRLEVLFSRGIPSGGAWRR